MYKHLHASYQRVFTLFCQHLNLLSLWHQQRPIKTHLQQSTSEYNVHQNISPSSVIANALVVMFCLGLLFVRWSGKKYYQEVMDEF